MIKVDTSLYYAVQNNKIFYLWTWDNHQWKLKSQFDNSEFKNYFSIITNAQHEIAIIDVNGNIYKFIGRDFIWKPIYLSKDIVNNILIINKDNNKVYKIPEKALEAMENSTMNQILSQATEIIF